VTSTVSPRWGLVRFNETSIEAFWSAAEAMDGTSATMKSSANLRCSFVIGTQFTVFRLIMFDS
jgi:hypothetical protein